MNRRLRLPALSLIAAACLLGASARAANPGNDPAALDNEHPVREFGYEAQILLDQHDG